MLNGENAQMPVLGRLEAQQFCLAVSSTPGEAL